MCNHKKFSLASPLEEKQGKIMQFVFQSGTAMVCSFVSLVLYLFSVLLVFSCFIQARVIVLYLFHSLVK